MPEITEKVDLQYFNEKYSDKKVLLEGLDYEGDSIFFQLDDIVYSVHEDECDGYRNYHDGFYIREDYKLRNTFYPKDVRVFTHNDGSDEFLFITSKSGETVLRVGTENYDDYYPMFVCNYHPEALGAVLMY